jgi:hypothetical protein
VNEFTLTSHNPSETRFNDVFSYKPFLSHSVLADLLNVLSMRSHKPMHTYNHSGNHMKAFLDITAETASPRQIVRDNKKVYPYKSG